MEQLEEQPLEMAQEVTMSSGEWKRKARKDYNSVGIALLLQMLFIYVIMLGIQFFLSDWIYNTREGFWFYFILYFVMLGIQNIVPFLYFFRKHKEKVNSAFRYEKHIRVRDVCSGTVFCLGVNLLFTFIVAIVVVILQENGIEASGADFSYGSSIVYNVLITIFSIIIAPITEEVLYRGFLYHTLRPYGKKFAIILTSILFGLTHGNIYQTIPTFFVGLYLAYITEITGNIYTAIAVHMLNNLVATVTSNSMVPQEMATIILLLFMVGAFVLFFLWAIRGTKVHNQLDVPKSARMPALFTSVFLLLAILAYVVVLFMTFSTV